MQLRSLDELHQHIAAGGTMADFSAKKALGERVDSQLDMVESQLDIVDKPSLPPVAANFGELVKAIALWGIPSNSAVLGD